MPGEMVTREKLSELKQTLEKKELEVCYANTSYKELFPSDEFSCSRLNSNFLSSSNVLSI